MAGEADALRARLARIAADLGHLDAVIRLFDPDHDVEAIRPKRPRGPGVARRGERSRALLDVLREAEGPIGTAELVRRVLARDGQDAGDARLAKEFTKRVETALARQERQGTVRGVRAPGRAVVWEVAR